MAWIWMPDNGPGMMNPGMMPYGNPSDKEIKKIAQWLDEQKAAKKKLEGKKHKPRVYSTLEAWGITVLFGPIVLTTYYFGMKALFIYGQFLLEHLNAIH